MANRRFTQFYHTLHKMPVQLDCNFVVSSSDSGGLGITKLVGAGIENVFMHTTASVGFGNGSYVNPNPAAGYIMVQFEDNYQYLIESNFQLSSPNTGSDLGVTSGLSTGVAYTITVLGTTTAADWVKLGVPVGTVPAVGVAFIAIATGAGSGSGKVELHKTGFSGIDHLELIGNPQQTIQSIMGAPLGALSGPYVVFAALNQNALTAPADGTNIAMSFLFQNSFITNQGY